MNPGFNLASGKHTQKPARNLGHRELRSLLHNKSKLAGPGSRDEKFMWDLDQRYMQIVEKKEINLSFQHREFTRGVKQEIQKEGNRYKLDQNFQAGMQHTRQAIFKESKAYYHQHFSMSKHFNAKRANKSRGMDKG